MQMVDAGQSRERLVRREVETEKRRAGQYAPSRPVGVDGQSAMPPERDQRRQSDGVEIDHEAGAAGRGDDVMRTPHVIVLAGDVEGIHNPTTDPVGMALDRRHDAGDTFGKRRIGRIGDQFVILDEIDAGRTKPVHDLAGLLRGEADIWLDDAADKRTVGDTGEAPRAVYAKGRAQRTGDQRFRQIESGQPNAAQSAHASLISKQRRQEHGDRRADIFQRPRDRDMRTSKGSDAVDRQG